MTKAAMLSYFDWRHDELEVFHRVGEQYELIVDIDPVCIMESVRNQAARLGGAVHFIPSRFSDRRQPLNQADFGALKATARSDNLRMCDHPPETELPLHGEWQS
jgi:hypothetical protein